MILVTLAFSGLQELKLDDALAKPSGKIKICHSGNGTNFNEVEVDKDAWDEHESAHSDHQYDFKTDKSHPCPPIDVCSNIDLVQAKVPEGYYEKDGKCFPITTHRWCKEICNERTKECQNPTYEAIAVPDNEKNPPGKPWVTGMDKYCKVTPTPTPTLEPPRVHVSDGKAPVPTAPTCPDGSTIKVASNLHVIRSGDKAELRWTPTDGNQVNIYWKEVGQSDWKHAAGNQQNDGRFVVGSLKPSLGYTFGVQQVNSCSGGQLITAVVVDPPAKHRMFKLSYYSFQ